MQFRRRAALLVLLAAGGCMFYLASGAYVRGTADRSLKRAAALLERGTPADARDELGLLLWFEPEHPAALHMVGLCYAREENLEAAIACFERVEQNAALHQEAQLDLTAALIADRQFQRAETVLNAHLLRYPTSLMARRQLSGLLLTELRQRDAVAVLKDGLRDSTSDPPAASDQLLMLRDLATAEFHPPSTLTCLPTLEDAVRRHPDQPDVRLALGQCYWDTGYPDAAEPLLLDAVRMRPREVRVRLIVSAFLIDIGDPDQAESVLLGASDDSSVSAGDVDELEHRDRYWELRCRIAESRGEYELALSHIEQAASIRPTDKEYQSRSARLLQRLGRSADARRAYARSHELASSELELWKLSREVGVRVPTTAECERMASLYESLGGALQAEAWRRFAVQLEPAPVIPAL